METVISKIKDPVANLGFTNSKYWDEEPSIEKLKEMLKSKSEKKVRDGLKYLLAMMSKGTDVSEPFPLVAKLVYSKNADIKKMVYMYVVHFAEKAPNESLLAVGALSKELKDSNQLKRAHALRTLSSVRVKIIIPVILLALKEVVKDSSPYVLKAAAHAIPKVFGLAKGQEDVLFECLERLLSSRSPMVLGSAVAAFNEICPENYDLIHPHYRVLCEALPDIDEFGQVAILELMIRYGRLHFKNPDSDAGKESNDSDENSDDFYSGKFGGDIDGLDPDHRLLLTNTLTLFMSQSPSVIISACTLYFYLAPSLERQKIGKPLIRVMRSSVEIQELVLDIISALSDIDPTPFSSYVEEFYIDGTETVKGRTMKLEMLAKLANESNIHMLLNEFQYYVTRESKEFIAKTISAIGRCAMRIPEVNERCVHNLVSLLSSKNEVVVAESVIVLKGLLQMPDIDQELLEDCIIELARLLESITNPKARASIVWVVGEYIQKIKDYAPDILRQLAKTFPTEEDVVKIQIVNLSAKLFIVVPEKTELLLHYILQLAKYDTNIDIRDRSRFYRFILLNQEENVPTLQKNSHKLFTSAKPTPIFEVHLSKFRVGTISHLLGQTVTGYYPLFEWCLDPPATSIRDEYGKEEYVYDDYYNDNEEDYQDYPVDDLENFYGDDEQYEQYEYDEWGGYYDEEGNYIEPQTPAEYADDVDYTIYDEYGGYYDEFGGYYDAEGLYYAPETEYYEDDQEYVGTDQDYVEDPEYDENFYADEEPDKDTNAYQSF